MTEKLMQWRRSSAGSLELFAQDDLDNWVHYKNHLHYQKDQPCSSNSGFATAQYLLKLGYKYVQCSD